MKLFYAIDSQTRRANAVNFCPHCVKASRQIRDFRLAGGHLDKVLPFASWRPSSHYPCQARSSQRPAEENILADKAARRCLGDDITVFKINLCAKFCQSSQVDIDRPVADANSRPASKLQPCRIVPKAAPKSRYSRAFSAQYRIRRQDYRPPSRQCEYRRPRSHSTFGPERP